MSSLLFNTVLYIKPFPLLHISLSLIIVTIHVWYLYNPMPFPPLETCFPLIFRFAYFFFSWAYFSLSSCNTWKKLFLSLFGLMMHLLLGSSSSSCIYDLSFFLFSLYIKLTYFSCQAIPSLKRNKWSCQHDLALVSDDWERKREKLTLARSCSDSLTPSSLET